MSLISHRWQRYPVIKSKRNPALKSFSNERNLHFIMMNLPQPSWANNPRSQRSTSPIRIWLPHWNWSLKVIHVSIFILPHVLHLKYECNCNPHCLILPSVNDNFIASIPCSEAMATDYSHRTLLLEIMKELKPTSFEEFSQKLSLDMHLNLAVLLKGSR